MSTIRDVAEAAGVSIATVSRALHGMPRVSPATRQRVLDAAAALRYVASPNAASLASGQTMAVGVVAPHINRWFFAAVVHAAEERLRSAGYDMLLYSLGTGAHERRRAFSGDLLRKRVDAVLVLGLRPSQEEAESLSKAGPIAIIGVPVPGWASVRIDDTSAARTAVEHLLGLGHRDIGFLGGPDDDPLHSTAPRDRLHGYRAALAAAGVARNPAREATGDFTLHGGMAAMRELLGRPGRPTAVFAASDEMAMGAAHVARRAGVRVPQELSVIGIDDHEMAELFDLTTVAQPVAEQGVVAAELITSALEHPGHPQPAIVVPTRLVVRGSTCPPRA